MEKQCQVFPSIIFASSTIRGTQYNIFNINGSIKSDEDLRKRANKSFTMVEIQIKEFSFTGEMVLSYYI